MLNQVFLQLSMLFLESKLEYTFSVFDKLNSPFTIWHYFSNYYKFVIVIDLVYAQHVTE